MSETRVPADRLTGLLDKYGTPDKALLGKLPKPTKKENPKGRCNECGGWHGLPAIHLDYLGHADLTRILIREDPNWNWEPLGLNEHGAPLIVSRGNSVEMWIKLTVHGKTVIGVGTSENKGDAAKELIGDALRNAAMRLGIALSLWSKDWHDDPDPHLTKAEAKREVLDHLPASMPDADAKAHAAVLWENHGPKGDGPFQLEDLAAVFAAAAEAVK